MARLREIASDFCRVKNSVYDRYGGIRSIGKLDPGYAVLQEMTASGLRERWGIPSVYFQLAILEALSDLRGYWNRIRGHVRESTFRREGFTEADRHYLNFLLRVDLLFIELLTGEPADLRESYRLQQQELAAPVNRKSLENWLRRQVRKQCRRLHADQADTFAVDSRGYRYLDGAIEFASKEKRKRIRVPLTDTNVYDRQLRVRLHPEDNTLTILVPVKVRQHVHADWKRTVGLAIGLHVMITTHEGHVYGAEIDRYQGEYAAWLREANRIYAKNRVDNPGRKKYRAKKHRFEEALHSYINRELNRLLAEEKPAKICLPKLQGMKPESKSREKNWGVSVWQRGYLMERLLQKCREQSVEATLVPGRAIGMTCSRCGQPGERKDGVFTCTSCGLTLPERQNAAKNAYQRGDGQSDTSEAEETRQNHGSEQATSSG
ncbi:MAG: transposase [Lachnospiraceae bacterium]|nr:transposase [Lachnospiraceae bacterium]